MPTERYIQKSDNLQNQNEPDLKAHKIFFEKLKEYRGFFVDVSKIFGEYSYSDVESYIYVNIHRIRQEIADQREFGEIYYYRFLYEFHSYQPKHIKLQLMYVLFLYQKILFFFRGKDLIYQTDTI